MHVGNDRLAADVADDEWIYVNFGDLGKIGGQLTDALQSRGDGVDVDAMLVPSVLKHRVGSGRFQHLNCLGFSNRGKMKGHIFQNLNKNAARNAGRQVIFVGRSIT